MADFLAGAAHIFLDPIGLMIFVLALLGGLIFGAIPGVSALTLAAILLPFTAQMDPAHAIMMFAVMYVSGVYGGAVTAILFNIPGSPDNAPTTLDGYPMAQQGKAGKAIGAAVTCSAIGGTASAILMMIATQRVADWAVEAFGPAEVFALVVLGLSVAGTVGAETATKGWLSVSLGLLLATVGTSPSGSIPRYNFDTMYLMGGIQFVPVVLGVFAISEVFVQGEHAVTGLRVPPKIGIDFPSFKEFWQLRIAMVRSIFIGFFAGILPGIGATLAAFLSYYEAVRWSRTPERFGKGELEGVVASETANNAATGAAMIPLLALGIPGGTMTAVMLAAFQMHGIDPGPSLFLTGTKLVWIVFAGMFFANISIFALGYLETKTVVHLLRVPFPVLAPIILLLATIGAYAVRNLVLDVWVMYAAGIVGYLMRRSGYSMAGIVLGVILGHVGENAFVKAMPIMDYNVTNFIHQPISITLFAAALGSIFLNSFRAWRRRRMQEKPA
jgi:putative tricarboxylic transport membrane protein